MQSLKGLATGIGSLPHKEAGEAVDIVFKYVPNIPFWPQLPKRDWREGMINQFSEKLPCLSLSKDGMIFNPIRKEEELEYFYNRIISEDLDYFKITPDYAAGLYKFCQRLEKIDLGRLEFIKCQITGPFTFAASIKDDTGKALLHDPVFMQVISKGLVMKALWQIKLLKKFGKKIIMFIDEPYLGCFGSAYTPINRENVVNNLTETSEAIKSVGALVGIHCCGNTDWSIFTDIRSVDIINFDASGFLDRFLLYTEELKGFLGRGGIICWGIVPTQEVNVKRHPELLLEKLNYGIEQLTKKGVDNSLLSERLLISPACGLGTLDPEKAKAIFELLSKISEKIREN